MFNFRFRLLQLTGGGLEGPFLLVVFIKIADGVFLGGQGRIQRDRDFRIIVVIQAAETFFPFLDPISIGIQQLAVDPEFFPFFRILYLFLLEIPFFIAAFQAVRQDFP